MRVFLIEDCPGFLDEVEQFLQAQGGLEVVGRSLSGANAVAGTADRNAGLVLMDWEQSMAGVDTLNALKALPKAPIVIVLAGHDHPHFHAAVRALGAQASLYRKKYRTELMALIVAGLANRASTVPVPSESADSCCERDERE